MAFQIIYSMQNTIEDKKKTISLGVLAQTVAAHSHCLVYDLPDAEDSDESSAFFLCMIDNLVFFMLSCTRQT